MIKLRTTGLELKIKIPQPSALHEKSGFLSKKFFFLFVVVEEILNSGTYLFQKS